MYKYLYAVGRYKGYIPGYHFADISNYRLGDLDKLFSMLYIVVNDEMYKEKICITLEDHHASFIANSDLVIQEWLDLQKTTILKTSNVIPEDKAEYVKLERLFTHGYFHFPGDINLTKDRQSDLLSDGAPDLLVKHYMYKSGINYNKQSDHALFTCNGVFYRSIGRQDGIYLLGAGNDYIKKKQDLRIGAMSFEKLGKVTTLPITKDMLTTVPSNGERRWKIKVGANKLDNRTVWIVVNGQLLVDQDMLDRVSSDHLSVRLHGFDAMRHHQVFSNYTVTPELKDMTKLDQYKEEALTMHNSFLVLIDNPTLAVDLVPLTTFLYPSAMHTEERFQHPIVLDNGLFPVPYMRSYGIKQRILNVDLRINRIYPIQTTGTLGGHKVNSMYVNQGNPCTLVKGFFFKIHGINFKVK
ncbi:hypothetical protein PQC07_gp159 [Aeromonas phage D3]|uniref:Virion structural protein n=2 Tax=Ludhianavirus TaxID=3044751 RepID=A0A514TVT0_9CAUD|nr:hypothetical protein PQC07_gp159 [Aeromonas phage D3]YP_010668863.1 hypothetical protein PQC08_gp160 [Aeromonas phage D6]QDJ97114.1 hypothetical protein D3_0116 [Aeromonas phage D3]QDJ97275.1 hypothetical protein D6_0115 [Aeromonas phage D6]QEP52420.1 hypothetical protein D9_0213 [Aeromonas phage D9]